MTAGELRRLVGRWERGEPISPEELARIEQLREESPATFEIIAALLPLMRRDSGKAPLFNAEVPDLVGPVMERIDRESEERAAGGATKAARRGRISGALARGPVPSRWLLQAAAALILVGLGLLAGVAISSGPKVPVDVVVERFELDAPEAKTVAVVGDFNDWQPKSMAMRKNSGMWEISVPLRRGEVYTYNFLVNGKSWIPDPSSLYRVRDGFGGEKSVLQL